MGRKVGEAIKVVYKTSGDITGKTVKMDVYDPSDAIVAAQSGDMIATSGKKYKKDFTPDSTGDWIVECYLEDDTTSEKSGITVKAYEITEHSINSVGDDVQDIKTAVENIDDPPMIG